MKANLLKGESNLAVVGLGYVGVPIAIEFAKKIPTIGFDTNKEKIEAYQNGFDPTNEIAQGDLENTTLKFVSDESYLGDAEFYVVAVPTPINKDKTPNLDAVKSASQIVGRHMKKGAVVVYESTVWPGVTEDICIPILEDESKLKCGIDFKVGYSPERINPSDKEHRLTDIVKVVSGIDDETRDLIAEVYELIIEAGIFKASSIKVAESVKLIENAQRDANIAFMNEIAMFLDKLGIETNDVIEGMNTKWNALGFTPGLVGGHCIGVDPYYFIYQAERFGYDSQIILTSRKVNDSMGTFVADKVIHSLIQGNKKVRDAKTYILGTTFKENCSDHRNSKVKDIINRLREFCIEPLVVDPYCAETGHFHGCRYVNIDEIHDADCVILAVAHKEFYDHLSELDAWFVQCESEKGVLIDVKRMISKKTVEDKGYIYWGL